MKRSIFGILLSFLLITLAGCFNNHIYVQQEIMDEQFLASTHANTPDPRRNDPPKGHRLILSWDFPYSMYKENLTLETTIRLWNNQETVYRLPLKRKRGYHVYSFPEGKDRKGRILTYKIDVVNQSGKVLESWKHQFWTKLIDVDQSSR